MHHSFSPWIWQKLTKTCGVSCRDPHACEEEHLLLMRQHRKREISWRVGGCVEKEWKRCCAPRTQSKGGWITALSPRFPNGSWQQPIYARSPPERKNKITKYLLRSVDAEMGGELGQNHPQPNKNCLYTEKERTKHNRERIKVNSTTWCDPKFNCDNRKKDKDQFLCWVNAVENEINSFF